jgi:glycosyltransferase involved in cell wall biosynthesis
VDPAGGGQDGTSDRGTGWRRLYDLSGNIALRRLVKAAIPVKLQVCVWKAFSRLTFSRLADNLPLADILPEDVVVVADASWSYDVWHCVEQAAGQGARVATIVYDLIPLNYPQFCAPVHRLIFEEWFRQALDHSDALLCISEATRAEVEQYCNSKGLRCPPTASFRLGGDLPPAPSEGASIRDSIRGLAASGIFFMTVGSIETRKNHDFMLDVFDQCWRTGAQAHFVIVGRPADGTQATIARIRNHALLGSRLFLLTDCSDAELDFLYRRARAVVLATLAEGFGLPLVEARRRGCEVLASRIPVFEEIADEGVQLFEPGSASALAALVLRASATPEPPRAAAMPEFSWRASARQFLDGIARTTGARNP